MSLFRLAFVACLAIILLPVDTSRQRDFGTATRTGAETAANFCQRNPNTCAAGRELWSMFLRKAEFGVELAAQLARSALTHSEPRQAEASRSTQPPQRTNIPGRATLSQGDLDPEWRGRNPRNAR
jgi:hypothetical protein